MLRFTFGLFACLVGIFGVVAPPAGAQKPAPAVVSRSYKIAVGDILSISAAGIPEIGQREVAVGPDGRISVPLVGQLSVVGLTLAQLEDKLKKGVAKFYLRPNIGVGLIKVNAERFVSVIGPAERSSKIPMKDGWRILDALATAGGLPTDRLEFYKVQLVRGNNKIPLDMIKLIKEQDPAQNRILEEGDTIFITTIDESQRAVTVFGQIQKTGPVLLPSDGSIATVIALSGGFTPKADRAQSYIERDGKKISVDLTKLDQGIVKEQLQIGDKLYIPENKNRYRVVGAVGEPGEKLYPDDRKLTLSEVLTDAKIPVQGANLKKIHLTRAGSGTASVVQTINVEKMMKDGDPTSDVEILPGDIITVDATKQSGGLQSLQSGLYLISGLIGVLAFFKR
jgi:polysaccharide export outer membrane protein